MAEVKDRVKLVAGDQFLHHSHKVDLGSSATCNLFWYSLTSSVQEGSDVG
jgi:hypothetical protein